MAAFDHITLYFVKDAEGAPGSDQNGPQTMGRQAGDGTLADTKEELGTFVWNLKKDKPRILALALVRGARLVRQEGRREAEPLAPFSGRARFFRNVVLHGDTILRSQDVRRLYLAHVHSRHARQMEWRCKITVYRVVSRT